MKKETFEKRLRKIISKHEDYFYSQCESANDMANFRQSYRSPIDSFRIFFFPQKNKVFLYDFNRNYGERKSMVPSKALGLIREWAYGEINEDHMERHEYLNRI